MDFGYFCVHAKQRKRIADSFYTTVVYTNLQIREGPGYPDPEMGGGGGVGLSSKKLFSALRASVWSKTKAVGRGGGWGSSPGSATASFGFYHSRKTLYMKGIIF